MTGIELYNAVMMQTGLRAPMEAGFSRMNDVTVLQASQVSKKVKVRLTLPACDSDDIGLLSRVYRAGFMCLYTTTRFGSSFQRRGDRSRVCPTAES